MLVENKSFHPDIEVKLLIKKTGQRQIIDIIKQGMKVDDMIS